MPNNNSSITVLIQSQHILLNRTVKRAYDTSIGDWLYTVCVIKYSCRCYQSKVQQLSKNNWLLPYSWRTSYLDVMHCLLSKCSQQSSQNSSKNLPVQIVGFQESDTGRFPTPTFSKVCAIKRLFVWKSFGPPQSKSPLCTYFRASRNHCHSDAGQSKIAH